jgi:hypothetical protein
MAPHRVPLAIAPHWRKILVLTFRIELAPFLAVAQREEHDGRTPALQNVEPTLLIYDSRAVGILSIPASPAVDAAASASIRPSPAVRTPSTSVSPAVTCRSGYEFFFNDRFRGRESAHRARHDAKRLEMVLTRINLENVFVTFQRFPGCFVTFQRFPD